MSTATLPAQPAKHIATSTSTVHTCYDVLDLCRGCGITDFTDGKYLDDRNDRAAYLAAQQRQADYLLDEIGCGPGSRILDIGCGYGRILESAKTRGAAAIGITISPPQVDHCRARGLDVRLCNYRDIFNGGGHDDWQNVFDGLVANGSLEHFVLADDALTGRTDQIYTELFQICRRLLRPGGKFVTTAIHMSYPGQASAADTLADPSRWPKGSMKYHASNLHRSFPGWFPEPDQLKRCADSYFRLSRAEDGTRDYYLTSVYWMKHLKRALVFDPRCWPTALRTFLRSPRATLRMLRCLLWDESWTYQFREPAPTRLSCHTWTAV